MNLRRRITHRKWLFKMWSLGKPVGETLSAVVPSSIVRLLIDGLRAVVVCSVIAYQENGIPY